jgi:hypothetical protein
MTVSKDRLYLSSPTLNRPTFAWASILLGIALSLSEDRPRLPCALQITGLSVATVAAAPSGPGPLSR